MKKNRGKLHRAGKIFLLCGIAALLLGALLLVIAPSSYALWIILLSMLINITGITLMTSKSN